MSGFNYSTAFAEYNRALQQNNNLSYAVPSYNTNNTALVNTTNPVKGDSFASSNTKDGKFDYSIDDGKISLGSKLKNFCKGLISPITNMFKSPKNFLMSVGMIAAGAALIAVTGGAATPILIAAGVTMGAVQLGTGAYKAATAKTDTEAEAAWQGMGAGTTSIGLSVLGAKKALKAAKIDTTGMNSLQATVKCFKASPGQFGKSVANAKSFFGIEPKAALKLETKPKTEPKPETRALEKSAEQPRPAEQQRPIAEQPKAIEPAKSPMAAEQTSGVREVRTQLVDKTTGKTQDAVLRFDKTEFGERITLEVDGKPCGYTKIAVVEPGSEVYQFNPAKNYVNDGAVCVELMESHIPGGGTRLHQAAVLRSQELGYGGRVVLDAAWNSHGFHYKSGFRPVSTGNMSAAEYSSLILQAIEQAKATGTAVNTTDLGGVWMTLPEENIAALLAK